MDRGERRGICDACGAFDACHAGQCTRKQRHMVREQSAVRAGVEVIGGGGVMRVLLS